MLKFRYVLPLACLALTACQPVVRTHGSMFDEDTLKQITPGVSRDADVQALLGTPSAQSTFDPKHEWYYIGERTEQDAFFAPEVTARDIIRVRFDDSGTVTAVDKLDKSAGLEVEPNSRTTPTAGHSLTMVEQILGNVGRFSPKKK